MATEKQKKALLKIVENGGNVSRAMIDAGYSVATAHTPQKLTESKAFTQYMEEAGLTDEKLVTVLSDGLGASKAVVMGKESSESFVDVQPDYPTRHKYLETALRVKGIGGKETTSQNFIQVINEKGSKYNV
jgi:hypothetical protein